MILKDVWEYNICCEYYAEDTHQSIYKAWIIISEEGPKTAWPKIFTLLGEDKEFAKINRMSNVSNVSAYPKKILVMP